MMEGIEGVYESKDTRWTFASDKTPEVIAQIIKSYPSDDVSFDPGETDSLGFPGYLILREKPDEPNFNPEIYIGMTGEIDGTYYLNLKLFEVDLEVNSTFANSHRLNVNTFSKVQLQNDRLVIEPFASSWIRDLISNNQVRIKHERMYSEFDDSSEILITASSDELHKFVSKYGNEENAYEDPIILEKMSPINE
ncbi:hypothetical protein [Gracilimonas sp.]|uniref:hypothetical protein n=1 Tax=Gracilimonas sp. TaxID=1974203 RepID=UPI00375110E1